MRKHVYKIAKLDSPVIGDFTQKVRVMAVAEGWAMVRCRGCIQRAEAFLKTMNLWKE